MNSEVPLPDDFQMTPTLFDTITVNSKMYPELTALINAAYNDEINLWIASGYRSVEEQESVLDRAVQRRMADGMTYEKAYEDARITIQAPGTASITPALRSISTMLKTISARRKPTHGCRSTPQNTVLSSATPKARRASPASITSRGITATSARSTQQRMNELNMCLEEYVALPQWRLRTENGEKDGAFFPFFYCKILRSDI